MSSNKGMSIQSKFSLKFHKFKTNTSGTNSARSSVSDVSTLVAIPLDNKKCPKASKIEICEEDLLDSDDQAWGCPQSSFSWSELFGRRKD